MECISRFDCCQGPDTLCNVTRAVACTLAVSAVAATFLAGLFPNLITEVQIGLLAFTGAAFLCATALMIQQIVVAIHQPGQASMILPDHHVLLSQALQKPIAWKNPFSKTQSLEGWRQLKEKKQGDTLYLGEDKKALKLGRLLGEGGSKRAFSLSNGEVLLLPQRLAGLAKWDRQVTEEVAVSKRMSSLGLLNVQSRKVKVFLSREGSEGLPAYICPSFEQLKREGIFILDVKNRKSSTWKQSFFQEGENRYEFDSWVPILKPLIRDLFILANNHLVFAGDSQNLAVLTNRKDRIVRYFGFDFSAKNFALDRRFVLLEKEDPEAKVGRILSYFLEELFFSQLDFDTGQANQSLPKEYQDLIKEFEKRYRELL